MLCSVFSYSEQIEELLLHKENKSAGHWNFNTSWFRDEGQRSGVTKRSGRTPAKAKLPVSHHGGGRAHHRGRCYQVERNGCGFKNCINIARLGFYLALQKDLSLSCYHSLWWIPSSITQIKNSDLLPNVFGGMMIYMYFYFNSST